MTPTFCISCRNLLPPNGLRCNVCFLCCHTDCSLNLPIKCPKIFAASLKDSSGVPYTGIQHYWIEGLDGTCSECNQNKSTTVHISGFQCYWCQNKVCSHQCMSKYNGKHSVCDYGITKQFRIPPTSLNLIDSKQWKIDPIPNYEFKPVIVFVNPKSGGQLGAGVVTYMNKIMNPYQIFNLTEGGPAPGLNVILDNPEVDWRVLACGGDGTVAWVLSVIDKLDFKNPPAVGVIPLGTGNDLARALGWGAGFTDPSIIPNTIPKIMNTGKPVLLDRWKLEFSNQEHKVINNYFSIGIDAKVALQFHKNRNKKPELFANQTVNKMWYAKFGTEAIVDGCAGLEKDLKLEIDGKPVDLEGNAIEALVVVNLPSCYGGAFLWDFEKVKQVLPDVSPQSVNDRKIEVVGIKNSVHLGQVQIGMMSPVFLGQGSNIVIKMTKKIEVQLDGEPWEHEPCEITISHFTQSKMFASKKAHKVVKQQNQN
uniref:Diacylglycerol kinase n=1 Tax=Arcella intermedia TaxID=1963864 RepID=A0A6B2L393_9EUKA